MYIGDNRRYRVHGIYNETMDHVSDRPGGEGIPIRQGPGTVTPHQGYQCLGLLPYRRYTPCVPWPYPHPLTPTMNHVIHNYVIIILHVQGIITRWYQGIVLGVRVGTMEI